jgi:hypothetical protein
MATLKLLSLLPLYRSDAAETKRSLHSATILAASGKRGLITVRNGRGRLSR